MAFDFPASPTEGQEYTPVVGGVTYVWNTPRWVVKTAPAGGLTTGTMAQYDAALTDGNFVYQTQAAALSTLTTTGNVGIGTASPGKKLSITGGGFSFDEAGGAQRAVHWGDGVNYPVTIAGDATVGTLSFATAPAGTAVGTNRMTIAATGEVGINIPPLAGTSAFLQVNADVALMPLTSMLTFNGYYSGGWKVRNAGYMGAVRFDGTAGQMQFWYGANSVAAGADPSLNVAMAIDHLGAISTYGDIMANGQNIWVNGPNTGLLLSRVTGGDSYIRSYSGNLYLGYNNSNNVLINGNGLTVSQGQGIFTEPNNQLLLKSGAATNAPTLIQRADAASFYFLLSNPSTSVNNTFNALRPFMLNLTNGVVTMGHGLTVNGGITVQNSNINIASSSNPTLSLNATGVSIIKLSNQTDGNFVMYRFDGSSDAPIYQINANAGPFQFNVPITCSYDIKSQVPGSGGVSLIAGNASNTGYVAFWRNDGTTRTGYIGFAGQAAGGFIRYQNENGGGHSFNGNVLVETGAPANALITGGQAGTGGVVGSGSLRAGCVGGAGNYAMAVSSNIGTCSAIQFVCNGAQVGMITMDTSTITWAPASDERVKHNILDASDPGTVIDAIRVRQFDWNASNKHQEWGTIAQELHTVAPEFVVVPDPELAGTIGDVWGVNYIDMVPMLLKEIQSLRARVAALEAA